MNYENLYLWIYLSIGVFWPWYSYLYDKQWFEKKNLLYDKFHIKAMEELNRKIPQIKDL